MLNLAKLFKSIPIPTLPKREVPCSDKVIVPVGLWLTDNFKLPLFNTLKEEKLLVS